MGKHESYDKKLSSKQSLLPELPASMFLLSCVTKAVTFTTLWLHIFAVSHNFINLTLRTLHQMFLIEMKI